MIVLLDTNVLLSAAFRDRLPERNYTAETRRTRRNWLRCSGLLCSAVSP